jgi:hypothetical protein
LGLEFRAVAIGEDAIRKNAKVPVRLPLVVVCSCGLESSRLLAQVIDESYEAR